MTEPSCSCCGTPKRVYEEAGHDRECVWHDDEMYRLAIDWLVDTKEADWKARYDKMVDFLLSEVFYLKT